jgi:hypothetical protein
MELGQPGRRPRQADRAADAEADAAGPPGHPVDLYRVLAAVESGEMEPARATAVAPVSRAIVGVYDAGLVEAKLTELEAKIRERAA